MRDAQFSGNRANDLCRQHGLCNPNQDSARGLHVTVKEEGDPREENRAVAP